MAAKSKFRHVYAEAPKLDGQYQDVSRVMTSGESTYVAANDRFFAYSLTGGGGRVVVWPLANVGRIPADAKLLKVAGGTVLDMQFHPFIPNMIATAAEDCRVAVTQFPMEGLTEDITEPAVVLEGHGKKVALVSFNPCANSILASGSFDRTVKVWNIEKAAEVFQYDGVKDNVYSVEWNKNGSMLAITSKDKKLHMVDPRAAEPAFIVDAFGGTKSSKAFWAPRHNWVGATGFNKMAKRQLKIWDERSPDKAIYAQVVDQASSVLMPYFDDDTGVLYMPGKGEGTVQPFELVNDSRKVYALTVYRTPEPQKGGAWVAKKALDVWKCEVARFLKLTPKAVIPVSFMVPRKTGADIFQEDIFPDCYAGKPALEADAWEGGENADGPVTMEMDPAKRTGDDAGGVQFAKKKTYSELASENEALRKENEALKARIAELEGGEAKEDA